MSKKKKNKYFQDWSTNGGGNYNETERDTLDEVRDLMDGKITLDEFTSGIQHEHLTYGLDKELENLVLGNDEPDEDIDEKFFNSVIGEDVDDDDEDDDDYPIINGDYTEGNSLEDLCVKISTDPLIKKFHIKDRHNEIEMVLLHFNYYVEKYSANYDSKMNKISTLICNYFTAIERKIISSRCPSAIFKTDEFVTRFNLDKPYYFDDKKVTIIQDDDYILVYINPENGISDILHKYMRDEVSDVEMFEAMIKLCYISDSLNNIGIGYTSFMDYELFESLYKDMAEERARVIQFINENDVITPVHEKDTQYPISNIDDIDELFFDIKKILLETGSTSNSNPPMIEITDDDIDIIDGNDDSEDDDTDEDDDVEFEESDDEDDNDDEEDDDVNEVDDTDNIEITIEDSEPVEETPDTSDDSSQTFTMENIPIYRKR